MTLTEAEVSEHEELGPGKGLKKTGSYVWNTGLAAWEKQTSDGGGDTQYTESDTDAAPTGTIVMGLDRGNADTVRAVNVNGDNELAVFDNITHSSLSSMGSVIEQTGGGTESGVQRVTIANDSTGQISINDGGNVITVNGTVSTNQVGVARVYTANICGHISTNTTTTFAGPSTLHSVVINTKGIGNTATIYDNTTATGTIIAVIDTAVTTGTLLYDIAITTGITIVTAGGTPGDITVTFQNN